MNYSVCLFVILLGAFAFSTAEESTNSSVQVINDVTDFQWDKPGVTLTKLNSLRTCRGFNYHFGERKPGDELVGTFRNSASWDEPMNKEMNFKYPNGTGQGLVVTYFSLDVEQTSEWGAAYVISGGVGKRSVSVVVQAHNTTKLSYVAEVYGQ